MVAGADFRSRISVENADQAIADLKRFGQVGEQAFGDVAKAAGRTDRAFDGLTTGTSELSRGMASLRGQMAGIQAGFARTTTLATELKNAVLAFAGLTAVRKVVGVFGDVAKEVTELRNTARAAGMKSGDVQVFTEALRESGETADGARQALTRLNERIAQARTRMQGFRAGAPSVSALRGAEGTAAGSVATLRGGEGAATPFGGPTTLRGSEKALKDVNAVVEKILDNAAKFRGKGATQSVLRDLAQIMRVDKEIGAAAGFDLFGRQWGKIAEAVANLGKPGAWEEIERVLKESGRWVDEDAEKKVDAYNRAVDDLGDSFQKLQMAIAIPLFPRVSEGISNLAALIEKFDQAGAKYDELKTRMGVAALEESLFGPIRTGLTGMLDAVRQFAEGLPAVIGVPLQLLVDTIKLSIDAVTLDFSGAIRDFGTLVSDVFNAALGVVKGFSDGVVATINAIKSAYSTVTGLFGGGGRSPVAEAAIPFAAGGSVPGSGHGDTVPAMLTPGEFVMRRAVVDALGAPFFAALNGGGGSLLPRSRFATGGLVADSVAGGTPVHLHIGGGSFPLNGAPAVVSALVVEAHRQHIRSAGVKPSWYGGR